MEVEMKMVKSLLLGTAAGLVAVAGAQAADMPVKAKPVQYVKICSLYGDGFYYIPGTDVCLKIGGYVRGEYSYGYSSASMTTGPFATTGGYTDRTDGQDFVMRTRAYVWMDSRQQTEYGTLRTYFQLGVNYDNPQNTSTNFNANRAFIQFAGFTVGTAQSFYDFYSSPASSYWAPPSSDTGDPGWKVFAYTAQFGNGVSSTVSLEEPRQFGTAAPTTGVVNTDFGNVFLFNGATITPDRAKTRFPDLVSNWRVDQAWGSAQIMFAAHDVSGGYYGAGSAGFPPAPCGILAAGGAVTGTEVCGHPADKVGWAAGVGAKFNTWGGSYFQFQVNYTQGAARYAAFTNPNSANIPVRFNGQSLGYGIFTDGIYSTATGDIQLTTVWGVNAAYDHFWRPDLRTSLYGSYLAIRYNDTANLAICATQVGAGTAGGISFTAPGTTGLASCSNNFNIWTVGSRTQWNITPWFYVGFDVFYQKLQSASDGAIVKYTAVAPLAKPTALYTISDQDNVAFRVRVHRDIIP
jgi:hypothetical protein